jgi:hypothetical protein
MTLLLWYFTLLFYLNVCFSHNNLFPCCTILYEWLLYIPDCQIKLYPTIFIRRRTDYNTSDYHLVQWIESFLYWYKLNGLSGRISAKHNTPYCADIRPYISLQMLFLGGHTQYALPNDTICILFLYRTLTLLPVLFCFVCFAVFCLCFCEYFIFVLNPSVVTVRVFDVLRLFIFNK